MSRLTVATIRGLTRPGRYPDASTLYLNVSKLGTKSWVQRIVIHGKRHDIGLGSAELVSLKEARDKAFLNRKLARDGGDPLAAKRHLKTPSFEQATERLLEQKSGAFRNEKHKRDWPSSIRRYVFPHIGSTPISRITSADVLQILAPIWHDKPETARRVRQRISAVMDWSIAMQYRPDNPAGKPLQQALGRQQAVVCHMRALHHSDVAGAIAKVGASRAWLGTKLAFEYVVLTAARSGDVRGAVWTEIDLPAGVWTIPATRMKMRREHRVPLFRRALEILTEAKSLGDGDGLVFPSPRGMVLSDMTISKLVKEQNIPAVPHGFRSSFRDWAAEETNHPREVVEAALAHTVRNQTEAAYARSDLFERRRHLMSDWADYLAS